MTARASGWSTAWWTVPQRRADARLKLICFPYAGAGPAVYRDWPADVPSSVELCVVRLPGRDERGGAAITHWPELTARLSEALRPILDRPFVLFGHSLGAILGFEVARRLRRDYGLRPERLLVSGRRAPHVADDAPRCWDKPDAEFVARLRALNGTPVEVLDNQELLALVLPRLRADFKLVEAYEFTVDEPLATGITAFGGSEDVETLHDRLDGWRLHTRGGCTTHMLPGGHFFLHTQKRRLLALINLDLESIQRQHDGHDSPGSRTS